MDNPRALGYSPRPPVSVCGTGTNTLNSFAIFLEELTVVFQLAEAAWYYNVLIRFNAIFRHGADISYPRLAKNCIGGTGISTCFASTTPFGFALAPD